MERMSVEWERAWRVLSVKTIARLMLFECMYSIARRIARASAVKMGERDEMRTWNW